MVLDLSEVFVVVTCAYVVIAPIDAVIEAYTHTSTCTCSERQNVFAYTESYVCIFTDDNCRLLATLAVSETFILGLSVLCSAQR